MPELWILRLLLKILVGFSFAYMGYWFGIYQVVNKLPAWAAVLGLFAGAILALKNGPIGIGALEFQNGMLFYFNALVTSLAVLTLFRKVEADRYQPKLLDLLGKNTIVLLCTNNLLIETIRLLDYKISGNFLMNHGLLGCLVFTGILVILEYGIIRMKRQRFIGLLFGKKRV